MLMALLFLFTRGTVVVCHCHMHGAIFQWEGSRERSATTVRAITKYFTPSAAADTTLFIARRSPGSVPQMTRPLCANLIGDTCPG